MEWLNTVPSHWDRYRIRFLASFNPSKDEASKLRDDDELVTFLPMENVSETGGLDLSETIAISQVWGGYTYCKNGDVIMAKITPCFENGKGDCLDGLLNEVAFASTEFHVLRAHRKILSKFLYFITFMEAFRKFGESQMQRAAGQQRVPTRTVKDYEVWVPSTDEQRLIVAHIEKELQRIDGLKAQLLLQIGKIESYRTSLISEAVTG